MKPMLLCFALLFISLAPLSAQPATPARPADPTQPRPAMPVAVPDSLTPPQLAMPSTNSAPSTNNAPAPQIAIAVIADSSLKLVLQELAQAWADSQDSGPQVPLTLTNAGTLRAKVTSASSGSAWDVVISADIDDVKEMTNSGLLVADGQRSLARNTLVIFGRTALVKDDDLDWFDLIGTEWRKVAMGNPDLVSSGRVARRALRKHDLAGEDHKDIYVYAQTETLALAVIQREQADAAFIYKTDAPKIKLPGFDLFPMKTDDAPPVFYTASVCRLAKNPAQAHAFIDYCGSDAAKPIWAKYGFETN
jgi:molybdate transport system substrate-binding protein